MILPTDAAMPTVFEHHAPIVLPLCSNVFMTSRTAERDSH
jgi:hypothetical protein